MAVLAHEMAVYWGVHNEPVFAYTENPHVHRLAKLAFEPRHAIPAWEVEIGRLLPVPAPNTALDDVLRFRERYADERERLMRAVYRLLGDLRRDYRHPADVLAGLRRELTDAAQAYGAARRSARIVWLHRSILTTVAVTAAAGGALVVPQAGWLLGGQRCGTGHGTRCQELASLGRQLGPLCPPPPGPVEPPLNHTRHRRLRCLDAGAPSRLPVSLLRALGLPSAAVISFQRFHAGSPRTTRPSTSAA
ncbi:hypothetical protein [Embleya sp. MST-111070]|uniref:hypothetical protein n=1 Tax=Embleya sp. MST-111070 TaxID=3398231 RepID=UPI003F73F7E2